MMTSESESAVDKISTSKICTSLSPPPASMRSSKSVYSQVHDTLMEMVKRPKHMQQDQNSEDAHKKRTNGAFLDRLRTYSVPNWMGKPLCLSPPLLSQYGWQCIGEDTIKCCSCSSVIAVQLPLPCAGNYREQCYVFRKRIIDSHMKICSWPSYPCSDTFVVPFLNGVQDTSKIIKKYSKRKDNLLRLGSKLPRLENDVLDEMNITHKDLVSIASLQSTGEGVERMNNELSSSDVCSILAMCGWDSKDDESSSSPGIICEYSSRSVRLHNVFIMGEDIPGSSESVSEQSPETIESLQEETVEPSPKKFKGDALIPANHKSPLKISKKFFHPLEQHCSWSHWVAVLKPISKDEFAINEEDSDRYQYIVNPVIENGEPSWKVLLQTLLGSKAVLLKSKGGSDTANNTQCPSLDQQEVALKDSDVQVSTKLSPKKAVEDFHRLMAEITSRK